MTLLRNLLYPLVVFLCAVAFGNAQTGEWTWVSGSNTVPAPGVGQSGVYGTLGVSAPKNVPGGRLGAVTWTDSSGNLWLFGGLGYDSAGANGALNDLWEFRPDTGQWAWVSGSNICAAKSPICGNSGVYGTLGAAMKGIVPGSRYGAVAWSNGSNLWLFGGVGFDSAGNFGALDDLWLFDPAAGQWAWMGGNTTMSLMPDGNYGGLAQYGVLGTPAPANVPGGRSFEVGWTYSGTLWLFGGGGYDSVGNDGLLNDLWKFDLAKLEWTWMGGSDTVPPTSSELGSQPGVYGTLGVPSASNIPGGRENAAGWTDAQGDFWLFGGAVYDTSLPISSSGFSDFLNDLWMFNPSTNQWAWMGGSNSIPASCTATTSNCGQSGVYGTLGVASAESAPGGRWAPVAWTDSNGNGWLFGGFGLASAGNYGDLSDLWEFNPSTLEWTWTGGSSSPDQAASYGTLGVLSLANTPGFRDFGSTWTDNKGNLWLFGGQGEDAAGSGGYLNDLWVYQFLVATPTLSVAPGTYTTVQTVTIGDATPNATIYYTTDGTTPTISSTQYTAPITVSQTETIQAIAVATGYLTSTVASATYTISLPPPNFSLSSSASTLSISSGSQGTVTLTVTPQNGFNAAVTFACSGLPAGATCSFSPSTVTPSGSAVITTLTIAASASASAGSPARNPLLPAATVALAGCLLFFGKRRAPAFTLILIVAVVALGSLTACGGSSGGEGGGVQPTTSTVTVTAISGSQQQSTMVTVTLN